MINCALKRQREKIKNMLREEENYEKEIIDIVVNRRNGS